MKLIFGIILAMLMAFSIAFATGNKILPFGTKSYQIEEQAPDAHKFRYMIIGLIPISETCFVDTLEGANADHSVMIMVIRLIENDEMHIVTMIVSYMNKDFATDVYEDLQMYKTGKASYKLTKVKDPGDFEKFLTIKKLQHAKKTII